MAVARWGGTSSASPSRCGCRPAAARTGTAASFGGLLAYDFHTKGIRVGIKDVLDKGSSVRGIPFITFT